MERKYRIELIEEYGGINIYSVHLEEEMKRSSTIESRRKSIDDTVRQKVSLSFQIVDRIHEILVSKGLKQKELAVMLGKSEAEISKWMRGTHNFTIDTIANIENVLGEPILKVYTSDTE